MISSFHVSSRLYYRNLRHDQMLLNRLDDIKVQLSCLKSAENYIGKYQLLKASHSPTSHKDETLRHRISPRFGNWCIQRQESPCHSHHRR
ncbi:Uncharacterized protein APZ42_018859 [Daphnia magna]|uniref:Uncharacterized protein n=1 Tax=Daphnia magna TaxID=35525 RepID=A0A164YUQ9_9CRUS|nr:Uncharacterized protein APZ42_018859 [Daphnia magna]